MNYRSLLVLDLDGKVTCKFGPFESAISGLEWGPRGHLYIDLATRLLTTSCDESQPLLELHAEPSTALLVSTKVSFLALGVASPNMGFQVMSCLPAAKTLAYCAAILGPFFRPMPCLLRRPIMLP